MATFRGEQLDSALEVGTSVTVGNLLLNTYGITSTEAVCQITASNFFAIEAPIVNVSSTSLQNATISDSSPSSASKVTRFSHYGGSTSLDGIGASIALGAANEVATPFDLALFEGIMTDVTWGDETSELNVKVYDSGSQVTPLTVDKDGLIVDTTLTITGNGLNSVGAGSYGIQGDDTVFVNGDLLAFNGVTRNYIAINDAVSAGVSTGLEVIHFGGGAGEDGLGTALEFVGFNDATQRVTSSQIDSVMTDVTDGSEDGRLDFHVLKDGAETTPISASADAIYLYSDVVQLMDIAASTVLRLEPGRLFFSNPGSANNTTHRTEVYNSYAGSGTLANFGVGFEFFGRNGSENKKTMGYLDYVYTDPTNGSEDSLAEIKVLKNGSIVSSGVGLGQDFIAGRGDIEGFYPIYNGTTDVDLKAGKIGANGKYFVLEGDATHAMTSLASGFDHHYIYIDDSASTSGGIPTIIDATTEPTWSDAKKGWYSGNDRCIGSVISPSTGATVAYFDTEVLSNKSIRYTYNYADIPQMATSMSPTGAWLTPDNNDGNLVTPSNATSIYLRLYNTDAGTTVRLYACSAEYSAVHSADTGAPIDRIGDSQVAIQGWLALGATRNIKISGDDDDDNNLSVWCNGFTISR